MSDLTKAPRKKPPKELAVIDADQCTGCQSCLEVCPADCIVRIEPSADAPGLQSWCEVDWDRCLGCGLCIRVPADKSDAPGLTVCPWEAIEMVPAERIVEAVEQMSGPAEYLEENRPRLLQMARGQMQAARGD